MSGQIKKVRKKLEALEFPPKKKAKIKRLEYLFSQFEKYPKIDLSESEMLGGIVEMFEAALASWADEKSDFLREYFIDEIPLQAQQYLDMEKIKRLAEDAEALLAQFKLDVLPTLEGSRSFDRANLVFRLGFMFAHLDHDVAEAEAVAQDRLAKQQVNSNKGPSSAEKRVWWAPYWQPLAESFLAKYPNVTNATEIARKILPEINAKKKATQSPLTVTNLARAIRKLILRKSQVGGGV